MWRPDEQTGNGYYLAYIMNIHIDMYIYIISYVSRMVG